MISLKCFGTEDLVTFIMITKYFELHNIKINECFDCKISKLNRKPHKSRYSQSQTSFGSNPF